jgi:DNA-binding MarR family transcriptional regulator
MGEGETVDRVEAGDRPTTYFGATLEEIAVIRAHPDFPRAMRAGTFGALAFHDSDREMARALKDIGKYWIVGICVYLHVSEGGLTVGRMRALAAETTLISPGTAAAVLAYLRMIGFLELVPGQADRRQKQMRPTARLLKAFKTRIRVEVVAAAALAPDITPVLDAWDEPGTFGAFMTLWGDLGKAYSAAEGKRAGGDVFFSRDAGPLILYELMARSMEEDDYPPTRPVRISVAAMARRFDVSRFHIQRLLARGEEGGLVARDGPDGVLLLPLVIERTEILLAAAWNHVALACRALLAQGRPAATCLGLVPQGGDDRRV